MKKIISLILTLFLAVSCFACDPTESSTNAPKYGKLSDADIWGAPGTEKVLQDVLTGYDAIRTDAEISLTTAKGEYEGQHIIITAKDKDLLYTVTWGDLKASDGTVFSKNNLELFHEKYIEISVNMDKTGTPTGWYPDAIVPYDAIVKAGENIVKANNNQGLYFRFNVPIGQKAGVYTGTAKLNIGGEVKDIPLTLNVLDVTVNEESHSKTIFLNEWQIFRGEVDSTVDKLVDYHEALFEYRLSPHNLWSESIMNFSDEEIQKYVDLSYELMQNPKCTNISIPGKMIRKDGGRAVSEEVLEKYLNAFVEKSLENNFNMAKKLVTYGYGCDEPALNQTQDVVKRVETTIKEVKERVASRLENDATITNPIKYEIAESLRDLRFIITTSYWDEIADYTETWCPQWNDYNTEAGRAKYADQEEKWWYGCVYPRAPYPTYHTEDTLLSARIESWMKIDYGVVGNLFWGTTIYSTQVAGKSGYYDIDDYYNGHANRYTQANGDGYLFYPGVTYGLDKPVGSLRLEAIRDGLEEYELLYNMINKYEDISDNLAAIEAENVFSTDKVMESLTASLYEGTKVATTTEKFQASRDALFGLVTISDGADACITDFADDGYGKKSYEFIAPSKVVVKKNGITVTPQDQYLGSNGVFYNKYKVEASLDENENYLGLTFNKDGNTVEYSPYLGGKAVKVSSEVLTANDFKKETVTPAFELVEASSVADGLTGQLAKVTLPSVKKNTAQAFQMEGAMLSAITTNTEKVVFHVYSAEDEPLKFVLSAKHKKQKIYIDVANVTLTKGLNEITVNLTGKNWDALGNIEYLAIFVGGMDGEDENSVYIADCVVYDK